MALAEPSVYGGCSREARVTALSFLQRFPQQGSCDSLPPTKTVDAIIPTPGRMCTTDTPNSTLQVSGVLWRQALRLCIYHHDHPVGRASGEVVTFQDELVTI